jgi:hypothetical protein
MLPNTHLEAKPHAPASGDAAGVHPPGSILARFLELRGRRVVKGCGALWYAVPGRFLMSLPYQALLSPEPEELRQLIRQSGTFGARFPSNTWSGLESGLYVLKAPRYDMDCVHQKHRPRVRRAMERFHIRPATKSQLLRQGRELNLSTMQRQGRYDAEFGERRQWETLVEAAFACSEISFPAAFAGSRLAAYMITCREHRWLHILHQMSSQEELPNFPNHLLTYEVTKQAVEDESLDTVCYGYFPLFAADGLNEYKLRFGYELVPHRSAIQLHPVLDGLLNGPLARGVVKIARCIEPGNQRLETIETVLQGARRSRPAMDPCRPVA